MYPDNQQNNPVPTDYLDQIAPTTPHSNNLFNNKPIIIGAAVVVLLLLIIVILGSLSGGIKPIERLAARLSVTASIAEDASTKIKSSQLRALNSDLKLYLTNTNRDITTVLSSYNISIDKLNKQVLTEESGDDILERLEDARLNAIYDRTYAREMSYKLDTVLTLMRQINKTSSKTSTKDFLDSAITNLESIQEQFSNFNQATS